MPKKNEIVKAVLEIIKERDLHKTPMAMIAERAGVGMGTIYRYFKDKEDIINEIYVHVKEEEASVIFVNNSVNGDPKKAFYDYYGKLIDYFIGNPLRFNFISQYAFSPIIREDTKLRAMSKFYHFDDMYYKGIQKGIFKSIEPEHLTFFVFSAICSWLKSAGELHIKIDKNYKEKLIIMAWDSVRK